MLAALDGAGGGGDLLKQTSKYKRNTKDNGKENNKVKTLVYGAAGGWGVGWVHTF